MNITFKTRTETNEVGEFNIQMLALPNSDIFKIEILNNFGSNIEKLFQEKTGINVAGASHLLEHMSFKSPRDYSSDSLLNKLKKYGIRNAGTSFDELAYFYKTTTENHLFAINAIVNVAYNDLKRVTQSEFENERDVVINEIRRYHDDKQFMFELGIRAINTNNDIHSNILGDIEALQDLTLTDLQQFKHLYNNYPKKDINIIYDPTKCDIDYVIENIISEIRSLHTSEEPIFDLKEYFDTSTDLVPVGEYKNVHDPKQSMMGITFDIECDDDVRDVGNIYLKELSINNSMFKKIRDEKGLTYGVNLYRDFYAGKKLTLFSVDVTPGKEDLLLNTLGEVFNNCSEEYNEDIFQDNIKTLILKDTLEKTNLLHYEKLFYMHINTPERFKVIKDAAAIDASVVYKTAMEMQVTSEKVKKYLKDIKDAFNAKKYILVRNKD